VSLFSIRAKRLKNVFSFAENILQHKIFYVKINGT
jgi:hypothetical protein